MCWCIRCLESLQSFNENAQIGLEMLSPSSISATGHTDGWSPHALKNKVASGWGQYRPQVHKRLLAAHSLLHKLITYLSLLRSGR